MKKIIVVTPKTFFPITATISSFLLMKHFNASDFAMGVFWSLIVILWIIALIIIIKQETVRLEDFVDEDTQEVVSIERNEIIVDKNTVIDADVFDVISKQKNVDYLFIFKYQ